MRALSIIVGLVIVAPVIALARTATPKQPMVAAEARTQLPEDGLWFAGQASLVDDSGPFVIYHVTRDGATEVHRNETDAIVGFGWLDGHTLAAVISSGNQSLVQTYRDGVFARVFKVAPDDWTLGQGQVLVGTPTLAITRDGEIWLSQCVTATAPCKRAALRVDVVPYIPASHLPATIVPERVSHAEGQVLRVDRLARVKPPTAASVKIAPLRLGDATVNGVTCHSAGSDASWPSADDMATALRPGRITWISADPPLYAVEGSSPADRTLVFRACDPAPLLDYVALGEGLWAELRSVDDGAHGMWVVSAGATPLAHLLGSSTGFVMAPR